MLLEKVSADHPGDVAVKEPGLFRNGLCGDSQRPRSAQAGTSASAAARARSQTAGRLRQLARNASGPSRRRIGTVVLRPQGSGPGDEIGRRRNFRVAISTKPATATSMLSCSSPRIMRPPSGNRRGCSYVPFSPPATFTTTSKSTRGPRLTSSTRILSSFPCSVFPSSSVAV